MTALRGLLTAFLSVLAITAAEIEVLVIDHEYVPPRVTIQVGDTVRWYAVTPEHTVTADRGEFDSGVQFDTIPEGESFSFTFETAGSFPYFCLTHGGPGGRGMAGLVTVFASSANTAPQTPAAVAPSNNASGQPLQALLASSAFRDADQGDFHSASQWIIRRADNSVAFDTGETATNLVSLLTPPLAPNTPYSWQVRHKDGRGSWSAYSAASSFRTVPAVTNAAFGLLAEYFNAAPLNLPLARATNSVLDFNWGEDRPHRRITAPQFSVRWTGALLPRFTEDYRLLVRARGSVKLWVDGALVVSGSGCGFERDHSATVALGAGKLAALQLEFAAVGDNPSVRLGWQSSSQPFEIIPENRLFAPGATQQ